MATITNYATLTAAIGNWAHRADLITGTPPPSDDFIQAAQEQFEKDILDENFGNGIRYQENAYAPSLISGGVLPVPSDWISPKLLTVAANGTVGLLTFKAAAWLYDNYPTQIGNGIPAFVARDVMAPATFTATLNTSGVLDVTAVASGILQPGMIISDTLSALPAAAPGSAVVITAQNSGTTGSTGNYAAQSISPLAPTYTIGSETMAGGGNRLVFGPVPDGDYQVEGTYYQEAPLLAYAGASTNWMVQYAPMTLFAYCMVAAAIFLKDAGMLQIWQPIAAAGCKGLVDKDKAERYGNSTLQVNVG